MKRARGWTALFVAASLASCAQARARPDEQAQKVSKKKRSRPARIPKPAAAGATEPVVDDDVADVEPAFPTEQGSISWYHDSLAGRRTASGERYDPRKPTCAHRRYPFGARVRITVAESGASAVCRVNDRGPFVDGRVLDVSRALAEELGIVKAGVVEGSIVRLPDESGGEG